MRCLCFFLAVCAPVGLAARIRKTYANKSMDETADHGTLTLRGRDETDAQDYEVSDADYESEGEGPENVVDGGSLLEESDEEEAEESAGKWGKGRNRRNGGRVVLLPARIARPRHVGPPNCCRRDCCIGQRNKRDKCIRELREYATALAVASTKSVMVVVCSVVATVASPVRRRNSVVCARSSSGPRVAWSGFLAKITQRVIMPELGAIKIVITNVPEKVPRLQDVGRRAV